MPVMSGPVKKFDNAKGFGFFVAPDGRDVMIHSKTMHEAKTYAVVKAGDTIVAEVAEQPDGRLRALRLLGFNPYRGGADRATAESIAKRIETLGALASGPEKAVYAECAALCREAAGAE